MAHTAKGLLDCEGQRKNNSGKQQMQREQVNGRMENCCNIATTKQLAMPKEPQEKTSAALGTFSLLQNLRVQFCEVNGGGSHLNAEHAFAMNQTTEPTQNTQRKLFSRILLASFGRASAKEPLGWYTRRGIVAECHGWGQSLVAVQRVPCRPKEPTFG